MKHKKRKGSFLSTFFTVVLVVAIVFIAGLWGAQKVMTDATRSGAATTLEPTATAAPTDAPTTEPSYTPLPTDAPTAEPTQHN